MHIWRINENSTEKLQNFTETCRPFEAFENATRWNTVNIIAHTHTYVFINVRRGLTANALHVHVHSPKCTHISKGKLHYTHDESLVEGKTTRALGQVSRRGILRGLTCPPPPRLPYIKFRWKPALQIWVFIGFITSPVVYELFYDKVISGASSLWQFRVRSFSLHPPAPRPLRSPLRQRRFYYEKIFNF